MNAPGYFACVWDERSNACAFTGAVRCGGKTHYAADLKSANFPRDDTGLGPDPTAYVHTCKGYSSKDACSGGVIAPTGDGIAKGAVCICDADESIVHCTLD
jgi:hypothetical protein